MTLLTYISYSKQVLNELKEIDVVKAKKLLNDVKFTHFC